MIESIIIGIVAGLGYGITGYFKSIQKEKFEPYKFSQSVIVGALAGAFMGYYGWTFEVATQFIANLGLVALIENIKKGILRLKK
jgi:hypothetical protein